MGIRNFFQSKYIICFFIYTFPIFSVLAEDRVVQSVFIQVTGFSDNDRNDKNEEIACEFFKPTQNQVIDFFSSARTDVDKAQLIHERYSPCKSAGLIKFDNGLSGSWVLQSSGVGRIFYDNSKKVVYFFHKDNKWTDPYACTYGLGDDPVC